MSKNSEIDAALRRGLICAFWTGSFTFFFWSAYWGIMGDVRHIKLFGFDKVLSSWWDISIAVLAGFVFGLLEEFQYQNKLVENVDPWSSWIRWFCTLLFAVFFALWGGLNAVIASALLIVGLALLSLLAAGGVWLERNRWERRVAKQGAALSSPAAPAT